MNNYWFWNMLTITICVYILTLFNPVFFLGLSGEESTLQGRWCVTRYLHFFFVLVCMFCFLSLSMAMLCVVLIFFWIFFLVIFFVVGLGFICLVSCTCFPFLFFFNIFCSLVLVSFVGCGKGNERRRMEGYSS